MKGAVFSPSHYKLFENYIFETHVSRKRYQKNTKTKRQNTYICALSLPIIQHIHSVELQHFSEHCSSLRIYQKHEKTLNTYICALSLPIMRIKQGCVLMQWGGCVWVGCVIVRVGYVVVWFPLGN